MLFSGKEFKKLYYPPYFKVLSSNLTHHGYKYNLGKINILEEEFNPSGECEGGGLYAIIKIDDVKKFKYYGIYVCTLNICDDSKVFMPYANDYKFKTDKLILSKKLLLLNEFVQRSFSSDITNLLYAYSDFFTDVSKSFCSYVCDKFDNHTSSNIYIHVGILFSNIFKYDLANKCFLIVVEDMDMDYVGEALYRIGITYENLIKNLYTANNIDDISELYHNIKINCADYHNDNDLIPYMENEIIKFNKYLKNIIYCCENSIYFGYGKSISLLFKVYKKYGSINDFITKYSKYFMAHLEYLNIVDIVKSCEQIRDYNKAYTFCEKGCMLRIKECMLNYHRIIDQCTYIDDNLVKKNQ